VDNIDTPGSCSWEDKAGKRIRQAGRSRRQLTHRSEKEDIARANLDRKRPSVESALERADLQDHSIVVDSIATVNAGALAGRGPVEPDTRTEVIFVTCALARQEGQDQRIQ